MRLHVLTAYMMTTALMASGCLGDGDTAESTDGVEVLEGLDHGGRSMRDHSGVRVIRKRTPVVERPAG